MPTVHPAALSHEALLEHSSVLTENKRSMRRKDFQYKYGQRHHSYDNEKAPYPLSYDRHVLELESLDNRLARYLRGSVSFANFEELPKRTLDLGCGTGTWVIDAAREWPQCHFVGFDLVDIQLPLKILESSISSRIQWKQGNFLTTKLPFDDDEFDHVHIQSIATGVPENKWHVLFEEVSRVLRHGGSVEVIEDDAIFPTLPKWFTNALRARPARNKIARYPDNNNSGYPIVIESTMSSESPNIPSHDHALLESLYQSVFEHRFINLKPSSVVPSYLTTYFRQVTIGPVLSFPMPPLPPLQPLPPQITTSYIVEPSSDLLDSRASTVIGSSTFGINRPVSLSFSSSISTVASSVAISSYGTRPRTASAPFSYNGESSMSSFELALSNDTLPPTPLKRFMLDNPSADTEIVALPPGSLLKMEQLNALNERSLAMHLYRSYQSVLACQEAMWEELKDRIRNKKDELLPFGWDDDEELEELQSRKKFERLIERYRSDMQVRVSLWCSLDGLGWPLPIREPSSKAEIIEEERMRENMIEARKYATAEEMQVPCRSIRAVVGYNL
ncbi:hypothetical protein GALMADRAFT_234363 [Galerina marginata CBS 339.88]|uniref:Methyltransferase domain-containing protein n=1 Tax=Galerina marginata (strain CBS 339.88) TaxID=685588 RepID=A0A067TQP7_GALM3|nr:hypothetical protein GALMADRAFT_234363 [Galerina marginata CBS 339.88]